MKSFQAALRYYLCQGIVILLLVCCIQSIHLKHNTKVDSAKSITDAVKLYRNDAQIQAQVDKAISNQPLYFKKFSCQNDLNYKYVVITKPYQDSSQVPDQLKKQVIISCNIHARELITSQVCVDFITQISSTLSASNTSLYDTNSTNQFIFSQVTSLLSTARITVFYRGNDMRDTVLSGKDYCIRKDKNDIDINRNFPTNFNMENYPPTNQQYPGDKPLSEPFSQCFDNYLQSINQTKKINVYVDIHTGEFTLFNSFESENNSTRPILQNLKEKYCPQCRITSLGSQKDDQIANGQIFQDVKKRYKADHSVLMEIYGGYNDNLDEQQNCIAIFYPSTQRELDYYRNIWKNALLYFVKESLKTV